MRLTTQRYFWARRDRGYLVVLFVIVLAFVAIAASMHVLVLTSIARASRAYDSYRQGSLELVRLQSAVAETMLDERQVSVAAAVDLPADALDRHLRDLTASTDAVSATSIPAVLPIVTTYPDLAEVADSLGTAPADFAPYLTPELANLIGPRAAYYPEAAFAFSAQRTVFDTTRNYEIVVRARLVAVPLTRYGLAAYELPADIGSAPPVSTPVTMLPAGLVPSRDEAFVADLQARSGVLPYHYRRRAVLSAAYQYVFSQAYIDRVADYAGAAHYCELGGTGDETASLAGLTTAGAASTWDLGQAGSGTFGSMTTSSEAAVVFTEEGGHALRLVDSIESGTLSPLFLLVLGPSHSNAGPLNVTFASIARPFVFIGYNVRVVAPASASIAGALFLDPTSTLSTTGPVTLAHLSYWAGATAVDTSNITTNVALPPSAEALAPRVVYVTTTASRL